MGGAYLETDQPERFPVNGIVNIRVPLSKKGKPSSISTQGLVIHHNASGIGVMFVDESTSFVKQLCEHCHEHPNGVKKLKAAQPGIVSVE